MMTPFTSPTPTRPKKEPDRPLSRSQMGETTSDVQQIRNTPSMAESLVPGPYRTTLVTPSPMSPLKESATALTEATEAMTPMTEATPLSSMSPLPTMDTPYSVAVSSQPGTAPTTAPMPRVPPSAEAYTSQTALLQEGCRDESRFRDESHLTPRDDWRIRATLFRDDTPAKQHSPQQTQRGRPPPQDRPEESALFPPTTIASDSEPDFTSHRHLRTYSQGSLTRHSKLHRGGIETDSWTVNDNCGLAERRRTSANTNSSSSLMRMMSASPLLHSENNIKVEALKLTHDRSISSSDSTDSCSSTPDRTDAAFKRRALRNARNSSGSHAMSPLSRDDMPTESRFAFWLLKLKRIRTNSLVVILCLVGLASLGMTALTTRIAIAPDGVVEHRAFTLQPFRPDQGLPDRASNGLRGITTKVHEKQKKKQPSTNQERKLSPPPQKHDKHEKDHHHKDKDSHTKKKKDHHPHHKSHEKENHDHSTSHHDNKKATEVKKAISKESQTKSSETTSALPVAKPTAQLVVVNRRHFDDVDANMYLKKDSQKAATQSPRILFLDKTSPDPPESRKVKLFEADFTDNTQFYGVLDSDDEHLSRMEIREPYTQGECVPMQEWQTTYHPSCNGMHELGLDHLGHEETGNDMQLFGTKGYWRNAWEVDVVGGETRLEDRETIVLKTLKFEHNFEDAHFEHDRIDAVAMERLTSSPHVINLFGFCGHSVMTEYANGMGVGKLADKSKKKPLARLKIASNIAHGLADVHGIDGDGNATFVHLDINPANVVSIDGTLKLNDFNIGILLRWNTTSNQQCGFPAQYPNPQWRSPEEARNEQNLTERVDVFSMGHILFRLICGREPWNKLEPGGKPDKAEITKKVQKGVLPFIPDEVTNTKNREVAAIRDAMLQCYTFDPKKRPSARSIANFLDKALDELSSSKESSS